MPSPSYEVSARLVWVVVRTLERAGFPADALFDGLAFDRATLRSLRHISWADYATICENTRRIVGSDDALVDLLESGYHEAIPELRALAAVVIEPKKFCKLLVEVVNPMAFPALELECTDLGGEDVSILFRARPGAAPNRAFFLGSIGAVRGMTRHLDLPSAELLRVEVGDTFGVYDVRLPRPRTRVVRVRRLSRMLLRRITEPLTLGHDFVDLSEERLEEATLNWVLTPRQTEVLERLVQGDSNKEIAHALGVAENTVELHVTQLLKKAGAQSRAQLIARFWSE